MLVPLMRTEYSPEESWSFRHSGEGLHSLMLLQCAVVAFELTGWMMTRVRYRQRSQGHGAAIQDSDNNVTYYISDLDKARVSQPCLIMMETPGLTYLSHIIIGKVLALFDRNLLACQQTRP